MNSEIGAGWGPGRPAGSAENRAPVSIFGLPAAHGGPRFGAQNEPETSPFWGPFWGQKPPQKCKKLTFS